MYHLATLQLEPLFGQARNLQQLTGELEKKSFPMSKFFVKVFLATQHFSILINQVPSTLFLLLFSTQLI
jgi:hypothetical protein